MTRLLAALAVLVAVLTACTSHADHHEAAAASGAPHNDADVTFARNMIPHHQQAVAMAAMVPTNTANPDLRVIATDIGSSQRAEIRMMTDLLAAWGEPTDDPHADHHGMHMMPGMVDQATLDRLPTLYDAEFDTLWISSMIGHHEGAVSMAQEELAHGENADAKQLAQVIVQTQQREISVMNHMISADR